MANQSDQRRVLELVRQGVYNPSFSLDLHRIPGGPLLVVLDAMKQILSPVGDPRKPLLFNDDDEAVAFMRLADKVWEQSASGKQLDSVVALVRKGIYEAPFTIQSVMVKGNRLFEVVDQSGLPLALNRKPLRFGSMEIARTFWSKVQLVGMRMKQGSGRASQAFGWIKQGAYKGPFKVRAKQGHYYVLDRNDEFVSATGLSTDPLSFGNKEAALAFVQKVATDPSDEAAALIDSLAYAQKLNRDLENTWERLNKEWKGAQRIGVGNTTALDLLEILARSVKRFAQEYQALDAEVGRVLRRRR